MTREERRQLFIQQRAAELRAQGKPVDRAALSARFDELASTQEGRERITEKVQLRVAATTPAAPTPAAPTPAAPTPATPTPTPAAQTPAAQTPAAQTPANNQFDQPSQPSGSSFIEEILKRQEEANRIREEQFARDRAAQAEALRKQQERAYNEAKLLTDRQIEQLNSAKAGVERDFANRRTLTLKDIANIQSQNRANLSGIIRQTSGQRRQGLSSLAARGRGIDPSASRRFLAGLNADQASALAGASGGTFEQISRLRQNLDADEQSTQAKIADLSRLSTYLGTNVSNYFPGVS
jgi:hypothetical protein